MCLLIVLNLCFLFLVLFSYWEEACNRLLADSSDSVHDFFFYVLGRLGAPSVSFDDKKASTIEWKSCLKFRQ
jgi:hypothetical protein